MKRTRDFADLISAKMAADPALREAMEEEAFNAYLATQFYEARKRAGLTQKQLAEAAGTRQSVISRIEDSDYGGRSTRTLQKIARVLGQKVRLDLYPTRPGRPTSGGLVMPKAISVAKEFARLAGAGVEPDPLTNLRLQKLLYYAQSWALVTRKSQLFSERVEAWRYGPVVKEIYDGLPDDLGKAPIDPAFFDGAPELEAEDAVFVAAVWEAYKRYSPTALLEMTHKEAPWKDVWGDRPPASICHEEITPESMETFFSKQDMVASLSDYEHRHERLEKEAWEEICGMPHLDVEILEKYAIAE